MRRMRSGCCARAPSGHAAATLPSSVMNVRRFIVWMPPVLRTERIAHLGTEETAALRDFDAAYDRSGVKIGLCGDVRCMTAFPPRTDIRRHT
jgi:hypothetical protein